MRASLAARLPASTTESIVASAATKAPRPRPTKRVSKRALQATPAYRLERLTTLYHQAKNFLPIASSSQPHALSDAITHAFAPVTAHSQVLPKAYDTRSMITAQLDIAHNAHKGTLSLTRGGANLNGSRSHATTGFDSVKDRDTVQDSFDSIWEDGAEPPLKARVRRTVDRLHGTLAGGQAGPHTIEETKETAEATVASWKASLEKRRERDAKRLAAVAQERERLRREEEDFSKSFGS